MFNFLLLLISSVIVSRFLEKRYRIASLFHAILFFFLAIVHLFSSDIPFLVIACKNLVGEYYYQALNEALTKNLTFIECGFSVFMVVEYVVLLVIGIISVVAIIKALKKLTAKIKVFKLSDVELNFVSEQNIVCNCDRPFAYHKTYLELGQLRN